MGHNWPKNLIAMTDFGIDGLTLVPDVVTVEEERFIIENLAKEPGHKVAQIHPATEFGWKFLDRRGEKRGSPSPLTADDYLGPMPDWLVKAWEVCRCRSTLPPACRDVKTPDHALVNVYAPGDGCAEHVDDLVFWTDWVAGLSLQSGCIINFRNMETKTMSPIYVPPRSLYVLSGDARYKHTHSIAFAVADLIDGKPLPRKKRTSITFRNIAPTMLPPALRKQTKPSK